MNKECNDYLKTRKGLRSLLQQYCYPGVRVADAIRMFANDWDWPLCLL